MIWLLLFLGTLWICSLFTLYALVRPERNPVRESSYSFSYSLQKMHPEPWRDHVRVSEFYILPLSLVLLFVEANQLVRIRKTEEPKQIALEEDLLTNGLCEPLTMYVDENGKVRYQDGHHRMEIMQSHADKFPYVPVLLVRTDRIRAYGLPLHSEVEQLFSFLSLH